MNPAAVLKEKVEGMLGLKSAACADHSSERPTILIATIDPQIHSGLADLFEAFSLNTIWLKGVEAAKAALSRERVAACLCGFWLQDGTYRELVRHIRRGRVEIPVVIVSAPDCPHEYRDYLAALNIGALDYLCHPYRKSELERILLLALGAHMRSARHKSSPVMASELPAQRA